MIPVAVVSTRGSYRISLFLFFLTVSSVSYGQTEKSNVLPATATLESLSSALKDPDFSVRMQAAGALKRIGKSAVVLLISSLTDANANARGMSAYALGEIQDDRAVGPLIATLNDTDKYVRQYTVQALAKIKGTQVVEPLIGILKDDADFVRQDVAEALGKIKDPRAIQPLMAGMRDSPESSEFRRIASDALLSIGETAVDPLLESLKDQDWQVRRNAALVLGRIKNVRAVEALLKGLREHDPGILVGAHRFFIERAEPGSEDALIQGLNDKGDLEMAVDLLNCGNSVLEIAASKWAFARNYKIAFSQGGSSVHWGGGR